MLRDPQLAQGGRWGKALAPSSLDYFAHLSFSWVFEWLGEEGAWQRQGPRTCVLGVPVAPGSSLLAAVVKWIVSPEKEKWQPQLPAPSKVTLFGETGSHRGNQVKMKSLGKARIPKRWCPSKKEKVGPTTRHAQRKDRKKACEDNGLERGHGAPTSQGPPKLRGPGQSLEDFLAQHLQRERSPGHHQDLRPASAGV